MLEFRCRLVTFQYSYTLMYLHYNLWNYLRNRLLTTIYYSMKMKHYPLVDVGVTAIRDKTEWNLKFFSSQFCGMINPSSRSFLAACLNQPINMEIYPALALVSWSFCNNYFWHLFGTQISIILFLPNHH